MRDYKAIKGESCIYIGGKEKAAEALQRGYSIEENGIVVAKKESDIDKLDLEPDICSNKALLLLKKLGVEKEEDS